MRTLVSIVVPVYNSKPFVRATLRSILAQDCRPLELIVVDDASSDGTAEVLRSLGDPRLRVLRNGTNRGIAESRNRGLAAARGRYVGFFDHDDLMLPGVIARRLACLESEPRAKAAFGYAKGMIDRRGRLLKRLSAWWDKNYWDPLLRFCRRCRVIDMREMRPYFPPSFPLLTDVLMLRSTALKVGRFDPSFETGDDSDFICRLARLTPLHFVDVPVKLYRLHGGNKSSITPQRVIDREKRRLLKLYFPPRPGAPIPR